MRIIMDWGSCSICRRRGALTECVVNGSRLLLCSYCYMIAEMRGLCGRPRRPVARAEPDEEVIKRIAGKRFKYGYSRRARSGYSSGASSSR